MQTQRISRTTTISLPPKLFKEAMTMAKAKGMTYSELFRDALRRYQREEQEWQRLLSYGRAKGKKAGIRTLIDIERLIDGLRKLAN